MTALLLSTLAAIGLPADWSALSFKNIPPLRHEIAADRITLRIDRAAGGIVRKLPVGTRVSRITVRGRIEGNLTTRENARWQKGNDDALLRVGLVHAGGKPLNALQRNTAPGWIRTLDKVLCADGRGPARIDNFLLTPHRTWIGKSRQHPKMKQLHEQFTASPDHDGGFTLTASFDPPIDALGLWLMADGDDSDSTFSVIISDIDLTAP